MNDKKNKHIYLDNRIIKTLQDDHSSIDKAFINDTNNHIHFKWPTLLEYLDLGTLFSSLPIFDQTDPLFVAIVTTLSANQEKEVIFHLYDHLFADLLNKVNNLPQINSSFLIDAIKVKRQADVTFYSPSLDALESALLADPSSTMHDLILYLSWDRMCVCMASLFDYQSTNANFINALSVLKDCLIESFQHITQQQKTSPSIYRMFEALFFYQMREEKLQTHSTEEWAILNEFLPTIFSQDALADIYYIDEAITLIDKLERNPSAAEECYLTLDSPQKVKTRLALAHYMLKKLKVENSEWALHDSLLAMRIVYLLDQK